MATTGEMAVTASIPFFGAHLYIRRAVESLLAQTHRNLTVVVVSDGDPRPPWPDLSRIRDPRLIRFSLATNRGPYFAHQVVLAASTTPYFLIQDADDWSSPSRVKTLLSAMLADGSDFSFSAWQEYRNNPNGIPQRSVIRWHRKQLGGEPSNGHGPKEPFLYDPVLTEEFINRASHHGIFRKQSLERIGGYYAGFRMNHDTLLTNLLMMTGRVSFVATPQYNYLHRTDSLSHSRQTGARSAERIRVKSQQCAMYQEALGHYRAWLKQQLTSSQLSERIRALYPRFVSQEQRTALTFETARLAAILRKQHVPNL